MSADPQAVGGAMAGLGAGSAAAGAAAGRASASGGAASGRTSASAGAAAGRTSASGRPAIPARALVIALTLAGLAYSLIFFQSLQSIVAPVFLALNFYIVVYPVQRYLTKRKVPGFIGASVSVILVLVLILGFFGLAAWSITELIIVIPDYSAQLTAMYRTALAWLSDIGLTSSVLEAQFKQFNFKSLVDAAIPLLGNVSAMAGLLTTMIMTVFFIAMDSMGVTKRMKMLVGLKPELAQSLSNFADGVRSYWVVATIFGLIVAILDVVALAIIDVPLIWVWGVLAFLTNYIPNIGFVIGLVPPALLAMVDGGWQSAMWVVIAYCVLNFAIQAIIQPKFTGESVGVTPLVSFLSLLFWVWVLGGLGALLALPATLLLKALLVDADGKAKWFNILIASDPDTARTEGADGMEAAEDSAADGLDGSEPAAASAKDDLEPAAASAKDGSAD